MRYPEMINSWRLLGNATSAVTNSPLTSQVTPLIRLAGLAAPPTSDSMIEIYNNSSLMIVIPSVVTPQWISFQPYPGLGCLFRPYPGPDAVFGLTQGQSLQHLLGQRLLCGLPRSCQAYRMAGAFWRSLAVSHWSSSAPYPAHLTRYWVVRPRWRWLMIRST